ARDGERRPVRRRVARKDPRQRPERGRGADGRRVVPVPPRNTVSFLSLTDADRDEMLAAIGVSSVEELFRDIPAAVRFKGRLDLEPALSEAELTAHMEELASRNAHTGSELSFLGAGIYDHYVPAVCDTVLQ